MHGSVGVVLALLDGERDRPDAALLRWAPTRRSEFNNGLRSTSAWPVDVRAALRWVPRQAVPAAGGGRGTAASAGAYLRSLDGKLGAPSVVNKRCRALFNVAEYAVEWNCLEINSASNSSGEWGRGSAAR